MRKLLILLAGCLLMGCHAAPYSEETQTWEEKTAWERPVTKTLLPVSLVAAYFGSIATHEAGHATLMDAYGLDSIKVDVLPGTDKDGNHHLGLTTGRYPDKGYGKINSTAEAAIDISGPSFAYAGHMISREALKTGYIPDVCQPTVQWYSLMCQGNFYGEIILGLARVPSADFGKQPIWMSALFGGLALTYDIYDMMFCDNLERYFKVLVGEAFYKPNKDSWYHFTIGCVTGGAQVAVSVNW